MADSPSPASPPAGESSAQEKARLRRERRAAKIQAGGASRLQAITSLQGGSHRDVEKDVPARSTPAASPAPAPAAPHADPDEVDISTHHYTPVSQPRLPSPFSYGASPSPSAAVEPTPDSSQDPMAALLQQMLGAGGGPMPGVPGQGDQLPPGLANMFGAMQGGGSPEPTPDQSSAWLWRLIHSIFSLALAIYIVLQTPFTGSKLSRAVSQEESDWTADAAPPEAFKNFFYLFATFEVVLQTSRYFIEKGQLQGSGILSSISQMLPEPYAGYVRVIGRYSVIYSTVVSDAMVVVFVLGAASWWNGGVTA